MCGIAGSITPNKLLSADRKRSALSFLGHRGPDGQGEFQDIASGTWLGHVRLSILDLSSAASQPMALSDGSLVLTFNGEIYNYRQLKKELERLGSEFQSTSDTEVLLHAWQRWGKGCLSRITGMFAFAVWEKATGKLFLGRDRAGEKPLYYAQLGKSFFFSSEISSLKCLLDQSWEIDATGIQSYLSYGYIRGEQTCWKGISKLLPGHLLTFNPKSQLTEKGSYTEKDEGLISILSDNPVKELDLLLGQVVKDQLIADVSVGLMLSGGLDSSLLASYITESNPKIKTFTVVFPGFGQLNEGKFAREISSYFGLEHEEVSCDQIELSDWLELMKKNETPISDPAFYPTYLMSKAIRKQCKVALGGDGADEIFGGYERYSSFLNLKYKAENYPLFLRRFLGGIAENFLPIGSKGRHSLMEFGHDFRFGAPDIPSLFLQNELKNLLKPEFYSWIEAFDSFSHKEKYNSNDLLENLLRRDFETYLPDNILTKIDRGSMLASLEVRTPFLDRRIVDFASRLSPDWKVTKTERKIILKKLAEKRLPSNWNLNRKQGFIPPLDDWLNENEWKQLIEFYLLGSDSYFNSGFVESLLTGQSKGRFNKRRIYALLVLSVHLRSSGK